MRTKLLLLICLMCTSLLFNRSYAQTEVKIEKAPVNTATRVSKAQQNELIYALCGEELEGVCGVNPDVEIRAHILLPAGQYKGCKITNVEIGLGYEVGKDSYVFISKGLDAEPIVKQDYRSDTIPPVPDDEDRYVGWKNVPLDEPYLIDSDDDLYIGWSTMQEKYSPIGMDWETPVTGGNLISYRRPTVTDKWTYQKLEHNVAVRITIAGGNFPQNHLRMAACSVDKQYYKPGEKVIISGTVMNEGVAPVSSFDLTYQLNDNEAVTTHVTDMTLYPFRSGSFEVKVPINQEGKGSVRLTASNPNGEEDDYIPNTSITYHSFGCLAKGLQKNVLINEMVATDNQDVPAANEIIRNAIENCGRKENVIWIQNHRIAEDEYYLEGYLHYDWFYNNSTPFLPSADIDMRWAIPGTLMYDENNEKVSNLSCPFIIDENFGTHLKTCLDTEDVFFSLGLDCELINDKELKITMKATPAIEGVFPSISQSTIALLITEDNIIGEQAGVEGDYIHNGIPRAFINNADPASAFIGDAISIPADGFTLETIYTIPDDSWNVDNLNLIFYLSDQDVYVRNAVTCPVKKSHGGIKETGDSTPEYKVTCDNGTLCIKGEFDQARILSINGQLLKETNEACINVSGLAKGIYCVLIQKGTHFVSRKFVVE